MLCSHPVRAQVTLAEIARAAFCIVTVLYRNALGRKLYYYKEGNLWKWWEMTSRPFMNDTIKLNHWRLVSSMSLFVEWKVLLPPLFFFFFHFADVMELWDDCPSDLPPTCARRKLMRLGYRSIFLVLYPCFLRVGRTPFLPSGIACATALSSWTWKI